MLEEKGLNIAPYPLRIFFVLTYVVIVGTGADG
jgi:hypothetical protein